MKKLLLAGLSAIALTSGATAADLGVPRGAVAGVVVAPAFSWTGFYLGGQIGYGWARQGGNNTSLAGTNPVPLAFGNGFLGGVHAGFNYQINQIVLGAEADIEASTVSGARRGVAGPAFPVLFDMTMRQSFMGSLRARAGLAMDRTLFYVTGGAAFTSARNTMANAGAAPFHTFTTTRVGWTVGAGVEHAFTPNWTARLEYRYANFGSFTDTNVAQGSRFNVSPKDDHAIRLGVSYLFSTGGAAVVARY
jgi:outer membrane immunogenic protein